VRNGKKQEGNMVISNQTGTNVNVVDGGRSGAVGRAGNSAATAAQAATTSTQGNSVAVVLSLGQTSVNTLAKVSSTTYSSSSTTLKVGSRGTAVTALQKNLTELGYNTKGTDGIFGMTFPHGSTGFFAAGDGTYFVSEPFSTPEGEQGTRVFRYRLDRTDGKWSFVREE
jgi:hypothetical protein